MYLLIRIDSLLVRKYELLLIIINYNVIVGIFKMIYYNGRHWKESRVKRERERERERTKYTLYCSTGTLVQFWSNF